MNPDDSSQHPAVIVGENNMANLHHAVTPSCSTQRAGGTEGMTTIVASYLNKRFFVACVFRHAARSFSPGVSSLQITFFELRIAIQVCSFTLLRCYCEQGYLETNESVFLQFQLEDSVVAMDPDGTTKVRIWRRPGNRTEPSARSVDSSVLRTQPKRYAKITNAEQVRMFRICTVHEELFYKRRLNFVFSFSLFCFNTELDY